MEIEKVSGDYRPLILVAEDDDSNFKLIKAIIGKKCEILWAKNGEEIVKFVRRESRQGGSYSDGYKNAYYERAGCYGDYSQEG